LLLAMVLVLSKRFKASFVLHACRHMCVLASFNRHVEKKICNSF
jgi:hypothetical protein